MKICTFSLLKECCLWSVSNLSFVIAPLFPPRFLPLMTLLIKTASLGLLEVMVVRVNAGIPDPPSVGDVWAHPPFFVFSRKDFWRMSGIIFLARALRITRNHIKPQQTNGWLSPTRQDIKGCRALGGNLQKNNDIYNG